MPKMKYSPIISIKGPFEATPLEYFSGDAITTAKVAIDAIGNAHLRLQENGKTIHITMSQPYIITWKGAPE
ncbi:MAG: hypothetical protein JEZ11_03715 [Desulfobacterales bacterium]|nr:hypothetical protein [Desulfobacterales bacterium]